MKKTFRWRLGALVVALAALGVCPVAAEYIFEPNADEDRSFQGTGAAAVFISNTVGYAFYLDVGNVNGGQLFYAKTTDGGMTWPTVASFNLQQDIVGFSVWYDRWTPGDTTGTKIHVGFFDRGSDRLLYDFLDTAGDTQGGAVFIVDPLGNVNARDGHPSITKSTDGDLYVFAAALTQGVWESTDAGSNWATTSASFLDDTGEQGNLMPLSGGDILLTWLDCPCAAFPASYNIRSRVLDDVGTWDVSSLTVGSINLDSIDSSTFWGASVFKLTGDVYFTLDTNTNRAGSNADIETYLYDETGRTWSQTGNVLTNNQDGLMDAKLAIDERNGDVYAVYLRGYPSGDVYYKKSTNGMMGWGAEQRVSDNSQEIRSVRPTVMGADRLYTLWYDNANDDVIGDTLIELATANYRSIGTASDYAVNTVTTTTGSPIVTGAATLWLTNNRGRGDRITIGGTDYTTLSVDSETQLTLTTNFTGAGGPAMAYNIVRKFLTLQDWEDCISGNPGPANVTLSDGWFTGTGAYTVPAGMNRLLVFATTYEDNISTFPVISDVTFGGVSMTRAVTAQVVSVGTANNAEIWYLLDANIPGGSNSFVVQYDIAPDDSELHAYGLFTNVSQVGPIVDSDSATTTAGDIVGPTPAFNVADGGVSIANAASGRDGNFANASWGASWTEGVDQIDGFPSMTMGAAISSAYGASGTDTATATFVAGANRVVIVATSLAPTPGICEGVFSASLVADNRREIGIAYNDSVIPTDPDFTTAVTINGMTTDVGHDITLTADAGNRNYGVVGNGVVLDLGASNTTAIDIRVDYVNIEWFEIKSGGGSFSHGIAFGVAGATNKRGTVRNNLIHNMPGDGIRLADPDSDLEIYNNIIYETRYGIRIIADMNPGSQVRILNNTIYSSNNAGSPSGIAATTAQSLPLILLQNNIAHSNANADVNVSVINAASSNNLTSDGSAPGVTEPILANLMFVNVTPGMENLHIQSGSAAQDLGVDLSSIFTWDIDGGARALPWDIGADDVLATTSVSLVSFTAWGLDGAVYLDWETATELNNLGFHLYRAEAPEGPYQRVTEELIPGLGSSPVGARYSHRDTGLVNGATYYYQVEDVETTGNREQHGPVSATPEVGAAERPEEPEGPAESSATLTTYGVPSANSFEIVERGRKELELVLVTEGFYFESLEDGTVRIEIPDYDVVGETGMPLIPVRQTWVEAIAGRKVKLLSVRAENVEVVENMLPAGADEVEVAASARGVVRTQRRLGRRASARRGMYPPSASRIVSVGFQGDTKKVLVEMAPLRWDESKGELLLARRLVVRLAFRGKARGEQTVDGLRGSLRRFRKSHRKRSVLARLGTVEPGLYALRYQDLFGARRRKLPTRLLRLSRQGESVAFHVEPNERRFGPGSTLYFVSGGAEVNPYGPRAMYELELSRGGVMMERASAEPSGTPVTSYRHVVEREENRLYQAALIDAPDLWLWDVLLAPVTKSFPFTVSALAASSETSRLKVWLQGASDLTDDPDHHVRAYVNGSLVGETEWNGKVSRELDIELLPGVLVEGENTLELENVGDTGAQYSMVMLNRFEMEYPRVPIAEDGVFAGGFAMGGTVDIQALTAGANVLDVTDSESRWLTQGESTPVGLGFRVEEGRRYLAVSTPLTPSVSLPLASKLKTRRNRAEYVVIGPRALLVEAAPLLELRQSQGLVVKAVATEEIYAEFGFGESTPAAVQDFLAYAYHEWNKPKLRYVLLLGDGTFDYKDYMDTGVVNQVPPLMTKTTYLWTASDPLYAAVNGDDILPDIAIGRLSAANVEQARAMVDKIVAYENDTAGMLGGMGKPIFLVADNSDTAGDFEADANELASTVLSGRDTRKIFLSELGPTDTRNAIVQAFDDGASLLSYLGHGGIHLWADEIFFDNAQVSTLSPQSQQPILITMNCLNGYFHFPFFDSLSETLVKAEGKGAIAAFSPSGLSLNDPAHRFHKALLEELLSGEHRLLGDAVLAAQERYAESGAFPELLSIYHLLGDPALRLRE